MLREGALKYQDFTALRPRLPVAWGSAGAISGPPQMKEPEEVKRGPLIPIIATLGYLFLYAPIVWLIVFSFNDNRLVTVWGGFTTRWYGELFQNEDVATTTDTRRVLSEVVSRHLGNDDLASVFPDYDYPGPIGVMPGDPIFANGFD